MRCLNASFQMQEVITKYRIQGFGGIKKKEGSKKGKPDFVLAKRSQMDDFYSSLVLDFLTKDLSSIVLSYLDLCGDHREKSKSTNARTATNNIVL